MTTAVRASDARRAAAGTGWCLTKRPPSRGERSPCRRRRCARRERERVAVGRRRSGIVVGAGAHREITTDSIIETEEETTGGVVTGEVATIEGIEIGIGMIVDEIFL